MEWRMPGVYHTCVDLETCMRVTIFLHYSSKSAILL